MFIDRRSLLTGTGALSALSLFAAAQPAPAASGGAGPRCACACQGQTLVVPASLAVTAVPVPAGRATNSWPQGKLAARASGSLVLGLNSGTAHISTDKDPMVSISDDGGCSWTTPAPIVTGENNARGTDAWALGVDDQDVLWAIVRSRGATNAVGTTRHTLYRSTDGIAWSAQLVLDAVQQGGFVPELFHDLEFVAGRMVTGYHFAASSRLGFAGFDPSDPAGTFDWIDVIAHGDPSNPPVTWCEPTISWDRVGGRIIGGLRTQLASGAPTQLYEMGENLSGFARWAAPESVRYSPLPVVRVGDVVHGVLMDRLTTGRLTLWSSPVEGFDSHDASTMTPVRIGDLLPAPITGSSEAGVPAMTVAGDVVHIAFAVEYADGSSRVYTARFDTAGSHRVLTPEMLAAL